MNRKNVGKVVQFAEFEAECEQSFEHSLVYATRLESSNEYTQFLQSTCFAFRYLCVAMPTVYFVVLIAAKRLASRFAEAKDKHIFNFDALYQEYINFLQQVGL